jgi:short-subunit dehydrogenase involved in D-alanine esterification of teichoic acids
MQKVDLIVESLARADRKEIDEVVEKMVERYPNLAESLLTNIGFELQAKDTKAEAEYV